MTEVHFADLAEILEELQLIEATYLVRLLDSEKTSEALMELEEDFREDILEKLSAKEIADKERDKEEIKKIFNSPSLSTFDVREDESLAGSSIYIKHAFRALLSCFRKAGKQKSRKA